LCNQLFQVAAAVSFSRSTGKQLVIGSSPSCGSRPAYWSSWLHKLVGHKGEEKIPNKRLAGRLVKYDEPFYHYAPIPVKSGWIQGNFQSVKFFERDQDEIRRLFELPRDTVKKIQSKHASLLNGMQQGTDILVHIRRADYLNHIGFHGILGPDYYERAISLGRDLVGKDSRVFVMSDDL
jgi:hypothetical protein